MIVLKIFYITFSILEYFTLSMLKNVIPQSMKNYLNKNIILHTSNTKLASKYNEFNS